MFGDVFLHRANLQSLTQFLLSGSEKTHLENGTLEQRCVNCEKAYGDSLRNLRAAVLSSGWGGLDNVEAQRRFDGYCTQMDMALSELYSLYFEAGLRTGLTLLR